MDPRLLTYYNRELQYIREAGQEFAKEFPKIAGRLGLETLECTDPYVERLLESFAFLTARVQLKLDAEFPRFTQHLLQMVYPHYLAPTPSLAVVQLTPSPTEGSLADGFCVPRGTSMRTIANQGDLTPCEYRSAHPVTLWPISVASAEYTSFLGDLGTLRLPGKAKAALRLRLQTTGGLLFEQLALDELPLFLLGNDEIAFRIYELMLAHTLALVIRPGGSAAASEVVTDNPVRPMGFEDEEALLPYGPRSFQGYRLLQEYFAFPSRFLFANLTGLRGPVRRCPARGARDRGRARRPGCPTGKGGGRGTICALLHSGRQSLPQADRPGADDRSGERISRRPRSGSPDGLRNPHRYRGEGLLGQQ